MSWNEGTNITTPPIYDQHGVLTFKKRSTFLATSVANLALVIGDGLRLQSFVLICKNSQADVQNMSARLGAQTCWAHGGQSGH